MNAIDEQKVKDAYLNRILNSLKLGLIDIEEAQNAINDARLLPKPIEIGEKNIPDFITKTPQVNSNMNTDNKESFGRYNTNTK